MSFQVISTNIQLSSSLFHYPLSHFIIITQVTLPIFNFILPRLSTLSLSWITSQKTLNFLLPSLSTHPISGVTTPNNQYQYLIFYFPIPLHILSRIITPSYLYQHSIFSNLSLYLLSTIELPLQITSTNIWLFIPPSLYPSLSKITALNNRYQNSIFTPSPLYPISLSRITTQVIDTNIFNFYSLISLITFSLYNYHPSN